MNNLKDIKIFLVTVRPLVVLPNKLLDVLVSTIDENEELLYAADYKTKESKTGSGVVLLTNSRILRCYTGHSQADFCVQINTNNLVYVDWDTCKTLFLSTSIHTETIKFTTPEAAETFYRTMRELFSNSLSIVSGDQSGNTSPCFRSVSANKAEKTGEENFKINKFYFLASIFLLIIFFYSGDDKLSDRDAVAKSDTSSTKNYKESENSNSNFSGGFQGSVKSESCKLDAVEIAAKVSVNVNRGEDAFYGLDHALKKYYLNACDKGLLKTAIESFL